MAKQQLVDAINFKPGDYVRSYDSTHRSDHYIEGEVLGIDDFGNGRHYAIRVKRDVYQGEDVAYRVGTIVNPPINGRLMLFGFDSKLTCGVQEVG